MNIFTEYVNIYLWDAKGEFIVHREGVPSPGHFFCLLITFTLINQINCNYSYMLSTYLSIQL